MIVAAGLASTMLFACTKDDEVDARLNEQDRNFMNQAAHSNLAEVELGQLTQQRAMSDSVLMYGEMMVMDHTTAHEELEGIAGTVNFDLPTTLDAEHQALRQRLSGLGGLTFDTAYINSQIVDHQRTISLFETQVSQGKYQPLKDYANKYLPGLRLHYELAQEIATKLE